MSNIDKELLIKAVKDFDKFTKSQKALLVLIIEFSEDNTANISIESLSKISGFSKTIIYKSLNKLEHLNFIIRKKLPNEKVGYIKFNPSNFKPVLDFSAKKQQFLPKKVY
ncbi:MAG: helix-turn-helix domain-containing protein [Rickettsia sp.]|jgi:Fe2+ or Zn2+ uptake regulation protein|nr:helix-turn-helix domain-containing protein [Rickettsia sp.]